MPEIKANNLIPANMVGFDQSGISKANEIISNIRLLLKELNQAGLMPRLPLAGGLGLQPVSGLLPPAALADPAPDPAPDPLVPRLIDAATGIVAQLQSSGYGDDQLIRALLRLPVTVNEAKQALDLIKGSICSK